MTEETGSDDIPLHDGDVLVTSDDISDMENTDTYMQELREMCIRDSGISLSVINKKVNM